MPIQITDAGANLKITVDNNARLVAKASIKSIRIVEATYIKLNSEACCAPWDYLPFSDINEPVTSTIAEMRDAIGAMLLVPPSTPSAAGIATEAKQSEAIGKLNEIKSSIETGFTGKATEDLQNTQANILQNIFNALGTLHSDIGNLSLTNATKAKQDEATAVLNSILAQLNVLQGVLLSIIEEHLYQLPPARTEDVTSELRYEGFALPGALDSAPVWAIRKRVVSPSNLVTYTWAAGSRTRSQIWNNRVALAYL